MMMNARPTVEHVLENEYCRIDPSPCLPCSLSCSNHLVIDLVYGSSQPAYRDAMHEVQISDFMKDLSSCQPHLAKFLGASVAGP